MVGIYIGIAFLGIALMTIFVDRLPDYLIDKKSPAKIKDSIKRLLLATVMHLHHTEQQLLIPITMYSGLEQGFLSAEFYKVMLQLEKLTSKLETNWNCSFATSGKATQWQLHPKIKTTKTRFQKPINRMITRGHQFWFLFPPVLCHVLYWYLECWLGEHPIWSDKCLHFFDQWLSLQTHWQDAHIFNRWVFPQFSGFSISTQHFINLKIIWFFFQDFA